MSSQNKKIKLPLQLAAIISSKENDQIVDEVDEEILSDAVGAAVGNELMNKKKTKKSDPQNSSLNAAVSIAKNRHLKELQSYVRAVGMRMGFSEMDN